MKNNIIKITILCLITMMLFVSVSFAYTLLEPLPGGEDGTIKEVVKQDPLNPLLDGKRTFTDYLLWFFRFGLAAAAFLAVLQITIAGVQMIFSGASEKLQGSAKGRINDALWGLALAFTAWLILFTINPDLAQMKLDIKNLGEAVESKTVVNVGTYTWVSSFLFDPGAGREVCLSKGLEPKNNQECIDSVGGPSWWDMLSSVHTFCCFKEDTVPQGPPEWNCKSGQQQFNVNSFPSKSDCEASCIISGASCVQS